MNTHRKVIYWLAVADGLALLALAFIAVPVKYSLGMPLGVSVLGPIHGTLFLSLMLATLSALYRGMLKPGLAALLFVGALIPLSTFYADYKLKQAYAKC